MTPLPSRLRVFVAAVVGALALVSGALPLVTTAYAQNGASLCANGTTVPDAANNPGLVSDCDALLASRDTLRGNLTMNWP